MISGDMAFPFRNRALSLKQKQASRGYFSIISGPIAGDARRVGGELADLLADAIFAIA